MIPEQHRYKIRVEYADPFTLEYGTKWVVATTDAYNENMLWYTDPYGQDHVTYLSQHPEAEHVSVVSTRE